MKYTEAEIEAEIRSMNKFAACGWTYGYPDGTLCIRGQRIQDMLKELKTLSERSAKS